MSYSVYCPYCDEEQDIDHDDGYGYEEDVICEQDCSKCGKTFVFTTSIMYHHEAFKCPCKNGGEHKLEQIIGAPREMFIGVKRCKHCAEEFDTEPEKRQRALKEYSMKMSGRGKDILMGECEKLEKK